jgi:antitoxin (DNA-binding transcriptional repressor) of toxin-antitoxin stability system
VKTIELSQATESLSAYALAAADGPLVVTDHGRVVAAMIPARDEDIETLSLDDDPRFLAIIGAARAEALAGRTLSSEAARRKAGSKEDLPD